jgi:hypothetical protein
MSSRKTKNLNSVISEKDNINGQLTDDFHIKSHLNTSFELRGIKVSEELIQKTLKAVREADQSESGKASVSSINEHSKRPTWIRYSRLIAGAAAAVIVMAVGINYLSGSAKYDSKSMDTAPMSEESTANSSMTAGSADMASGGAEADAVPKAKEFARTEDADRATDNADENNSGALKDGSDASADQSDSQIMYSTASADLAGATESEDDSSASSSGDTATTEVPEDNATADSGTASDARHELAAIYGDEISTDSLQFKDIFPALQEEISSINIMDNTNNKETRITSQEDIGEFYKTMDQQMFTLGTKAGSNLRYTIGVIGLQKQELFSMKIGDTVTVSSSINEVISESIYSATDSTTLLKLIGTFCK